MAIDSSATKSTRVALLAAGVAAALAFAHHAAFAQGDVFSSQGARGSARSSQPTGKGAVRDESVYRQQIGEDCAGPSYGGTRKNIPCGSNFQQPRTTQQQAQQPAQPRAVSGCAIELRALRGSGKLCIEDGHFRDEEGRVVILRGVNLAGTSKIPPFLPLPRQSGIRGPMRGDIMVTRDFDFPGHSDLSPLAQLAGWGVNVIRLLFVWEAYEPFEGERSEPYLQMLDAIVDAAATNGIYTIIDFHQDVFSRWMARGCGEGFPQWTQLAPGLDRPRNDNSCADWMTKGIFDVDMHMNWHQLYNGPLKAKYMEVFRMLVDRYARRSGVIGIDPLNEPFALIDYKVNGPNWRNDLITRQVVRERELPQFYVDVAKQVPSSLKPKPILFLEPHLFVDTGVRTTLTKPPAYSQVAYAPHFYDPDISTHARYFGPQRTRDAFRNMSDHAASWKAPLFVGEFGAGAHVAQVDAYMDAIHEELNRHFASAAQWSFTPGWTSRDKDGWNGEDLSIVARGGDENDQGYRPQLFRPRPYPQRIDGKPTELRVDWTRDRYTLTFSWENRGGAGNETTLYVPQTPGQPLSAPGTMSPACRQALNPARLYNDPNFLSSILRCLGPAGTNAGTVLIDTPGTPPGTVNCGLERQRGAVTRVVCRAPNYNGIVTVVVNGPG